MTDTGIVDTFLNTFTTYIDSGFGLLGGEVGFLFSTLIVIDVTIAGLFWAWGADEDVLQRLIKKTLYIGAFAFIIGNFSNLANILLQSFAGLGLKASGGSMSLADFMKPGSIAAAGLTAAQPIVDALKEYGSIWSVFANIAAIVVLLLAWAIVVFAFFIMAVQVFVTLIEFKLVTLAGFVLLPFAFWHRTAFMAEKVLGHIVSSGIKVLTLAVIIGIGTTLFSQFTSAGLGVAPDANHVMAIALAALALLGLSIFGPGIANGIVSGGPALGAGAAAGTALAAGGMVAGGIAAGGMAAGAAGAAAMGGARIAGSAMASYASGAASKSGAASVAGGLGGVGKATAGAAMSPLRKAAAAMKQSYQSGRTPASTAGAAGGANAAPEAAGTAGPPAWAKAMKRRQTMSHGASVAAHTLRGSDSHGGGGAPNITERE